MTLPLFLLPGLVCDRFIWAAQEQALTPEFDVRVFPNFYTYDSIAGMARAVLATAPPRFHLAGHSMGGRVAFEIVRLAPERVASLIVLSTGIDPVQPGERARRQAFVDIANTKGMRALADAWLPTTVAPRRLADAPFMAVLTEMVCRATPEIFARQTAALLNRPDGRPRLGAIACRTLVVVGRQDSYSPLAVHEAIAAAIPGAELAVIEDAGHMVMVEAPEAVAACLRQWLRRQGK
jgi:pimeloyl-ACP methyl ester carboxylesterase